MGVFFRKSFYLTHNFSETVPLVRYGSGVQKGWFRPGLKLFSPSLWNVSSYPTGWSRRLWNYGSVQSMLDLLTLFKHVNYVRKPFRATENSNYYLFHGLRQISAKWFDLNFAFWGALMLRPPTKRPHKILTRTKRPPNKQSAVTFYYYDSSTL